MTLADKEMRTVPAATTHVVDILAFVAAQEIPPRYYETPYYLAPEPGGEKAYALLRETLQRSRKVGIACVVIDARQHLAALIPHGQSLVLRTLRLPSATGGPKLRSATSRKAKAASEVSPAWRRMALQPGIPALAEIDMKAKKSSAIMIHEPDGLLDDDDWLDEDALDYVLRRRPHAPDGYALRATPPPHRRERRGPEIRMRRLRR